ncbi:MAG: hypothetical protein IAX21_07575 [Candidatus Bathyarchaeota archaeon]|nr:MAG: hypothetical protein NUK63_10105 [Candidatus Bathyarchaeum tardum]WNZ28516.1 MAG: hypothetical protein IAX21_07575 [Candidatus Bathyarchaeota archaeon]
MEPNLSSKMTEFMIALDQIKKYRTIVSSIADFVLILMGAIIIALSINSFVHLFSVFVGSVEVLNVIASTLTIFIFPAGIIIATLWVNRKMKSIKGGYWRNTLNEGAPGALKLLQNIEWTKTFSDIRYAKLGFFLYGVAKTVAFWGVVVFSMFIFNGFVESALHLSLDYNLLMIFSLVVVLIMNKNDLRTRYEQMGRLDWLLWELRWFESEFREADFEA